MNERMKKALSQMPSDIEQYLTTAIKSDDFDATISPEQFSDLIRLSGLKDDELRVALLPLAAAYAYTPISDFNVGAIVRGLSGRLYFGANMEFEGAQLGQTVHAEQCAISHAWMKGEKGVKDITINYSPCGHCRQFMNELTTADEMMIQLPKRDARTLQDYLPESFGPKDLGVEARLMDGSSLGHVSPESDPLLVKAIDALNKSHSPYTKNNSGISLEMTDGSVYQGAYAENAAFNPSLPPLQVAFMQILMAGKTFDQIRQAALAEMSDGMISHLAYTQAVLETINPDIQVSYISL
ncbi:cytidine deaminase [Vibrio sp. JC009]|uniref:cytidine deaminase n=1 Tax=Vibrio sp. JC009 TaxID=2912314 RepID=UPI0023AE713C|nr:cytidine deaminase [Vibrio sp. JC009]WED23103.1 cytidine deaminase [Vibrio sp. JC009]